VSESGCTELRLPPPQFNQTLPGTCYAAGYGSRCHAWDVGMPFCNGPSCAHAWCYVDGDLCRQSAVAILGSRLFDGISAESDSSRPRYFSFETCDENLTDMGRAVSPHFVSRVASMRLVLGIPTMSFPNHFKRDPVTGEVGQGYTSALYFNDSIPWEGAIPDFVRHLSDRFGAQFAFTFTSSGARAAKSNAWTAAAYEAAQGAIDVGGSAMWRTSERLALVHFSSPLADDRFYLYVPMTTKRDLWSNAVLAFRPFSIDLWLLCGASNVAMSLLVSYLEASKVKRRLKPRSVLRRTGRNFYYSTMQMLTGFDAKETNNVPLRIAYIGWAFLITLTLAAYTANFAAFLVQPQSRLPFRSVLDAMARGPDVRLCYPTAARQAILASFPTAESNLVDLPFEFVEADYDAAACDALIWSESVIPRSAARQSFMCRRGFERTELVTSLYWALPVHEAEVATVLDTWILAVSQEGFRYLNFEADYYEVVCDAFRSPHTPASTLLEQQRSLGRLPASRRRRLRSSSGGTAAAVATSSSDTSGEQSLTVTHFLGPVLVWLIAAISAVVVHLFIRATDKVVLEKLKKRREAKEAQGTSCEGTVAAAVRSLSANVVDILDLEDKEEEEEEAMDEEGVPTTTLRSEVQQLREDMQRVMACVQLQMAAPSSAEKVVVARIAPVANLAGAANPAAERAAPSPAAR